MKFFEEILSPEQATLLTQLGSFMTEQDCYLAGGTAIALLLGHRKSVDLDWFTPRLNVDPERFVHELQLYLKHTDTSLADIDVSKGTVYATANDVRISIIEFPYPMLKGFVKYSEAGCRIADLEDLSCMKLSAAASRGSKKDFIDIFALIERNISLPQMFDAFQRKFPNHDITHTVLSLTYFADAEPEQMPDMLWNVSWEEIKARIELAVKDFTG